ncbi:Phosphatidylinositol-4-phosphate 5-kinase [Tulasnella sp. JGI-2019a]|nr:Phosphatidylinositol-4-phosphate 5-kinase [Tulasnella sp. JGI-2019a]
MAAIFTSLPPSSSAHKMSSQAASVTSNSVSSFQTAPLSPSGAISTSSSADSFVSQRTLSANNGSRRPSRDPSPLATSPATTESPAAPLSTGAESGARRGTYEAKKLSLMERGLNTTDADYFRSSARRPEPLTQTIDAPPSPPLSVTPTKEKKFLDSMDTYGTGVEVSEPEPIQYNSPQAVSLDTSAAISEAASRQQLTLGNNGSPKTPRLRPQRSPTLPIIPLSDANSSNGTISTTQQPPLTDDLAIPGPSTLTVSKGPVPPSNTPHLLHPSTAAAASAVSRPTRRNTTGSAAQQSPRPVRNMINAHQTYMSQQVTSGPSSQGFPAYEDGAQGQLDSDILKEAEHIRAERRAKAQQEAEIAMTAPQSSRRSKAASINQEGPLVGKIIGEGHVNYVLMYNMLTGIRVAVSRCQAKIRRPLTDEDYSARHKFSFDV